MKFLLTLITALSLLFGCAYSPTAISLPDGSSFFLDGGTDIGEAPECQLDSVDTDIYHCGECENQCHPADTDRCTDGECRCGFDAPCSGLSDCRSGYCVSQDPEGLPCEFDDWCTSGDACIEGRCSFVECVPERCDGIDNDCDGIIDNYGPGPLAEFCYSGGSVDAPILPPCERGVRTCISGSWTECIGEVPPLDEVGILGCDEVDNNCDGCVDGVVVAGECVSREPEFFDVLFFLDTSGSMTDKLEIVKQAVRLFSTWLSSSTAFRWGIIRVPGPYDGQNDLYLDLTDFVTFDSALRVMPTRGGSIEPQWDAIYEAVNGDSLARPAPLPPGPVTWTPGSVRILILFTDEPGQTTRARRSLSPVSEADMCAAMTHGEVLISVVSAPYQSDFDDCAHRIIDLPAGTAGTGFSCTGDSECRASETCEVAECVTAVVVETAMQLDTVIAEPCGGV